MMRLILRVDSDGITVIRGDAPAKTARPGDIVTLLDESGYAVSLTVGEIRPMPELITIT